MAVIGCVGTQSTQILSAMSAPFLAADVGGTHVRVGLVEPSGEARHPVRFLAYRKFRCGDYPSLSAILAAAMPPDAGVRACVIASAGFAMDDGTVITTNLPWPLSLRDIGSELGLDQIHLVNDFEALGYAANEVGDNVLLHLCGPGQAGHGPILVLGPGTGLGAALWMPNHGQPLVLPTEAGQAALATGTPREIDLLGEMLHTRSHVPTEHALSGPGLLNLYNAVCALEDASPVHATPDAISAAAQSGDDPLAHEALDVFCALLGSTVGNLALIYGAQGGVHLAGGILPNIRDFLDHSRFVERFLDKGPMREALQQIPVNVVEHGHLGVTGAAIWFLDHHA